jgi:hypothetical protein
MLDSVLTCCHVIRTTCRAFPNNVDFWNPTPCWIQIDLAVWMMLLCRSDVFKANCWTLRGVRTPSKARPDGCIETCCSDLEIAWNLHGHLLETCDHTHGMKWDTVHITWRHWIEPIILLKSNRYIKCFCHPECIQHKILTNSPFGHSGTKKTWPVWKYIPGPKTKNTSPFCHKRAKGKQSIKKNHNQNKNKRKEQG